MTSIKTKEEIAVMREGGTILASVLRDLSDRAAPGVSLRELDVRGEELIRAAGATPSFKGYRPAPGADPYPGSVCLSVNDEIVHGIPRDIPLTEGDILTIDAGVFFKGFHADSAITVGIGEISKEASALLAVTKESLDRALSVMRDGVHLGDIGAAVQEYVEQRGFSVIRELVGHGIGKKLQEAPMIPNFGTKGKGSELREGMTVAIEPMVSVGAHQVQLDDDGFTYKTADGSLSAHFEHTVLITADGVEILTQQ